MTIEFIDEYWENKARQNFQCMVCTYFDLRVKNNLSEDEIKQFLEISKNKLENNNYKVYFTGETYTYKNNNMIVKDNELMIAIRSLI